MSSYKDADKLLSSFKNSYLAACKWEEEAKDEEIKVRANSAKVTFLECYLRTKEMPTADVEEVKHGMWIPIQGEYHWAETGVVAPITLGYKCSICGDEEKYKYKYCHCGARMQK